MHYKDFFELLGNSHPTCIADNNKIIDMNDIKNYNHKNDLYFIPNGGGMKSNDITQFNAFFIDLDCGRDENGNYYPIHHVKQYKL